MVYHKSSAINMYHHHNLGSVSANGSNGRSGSGASSNSSTSATGLLGNASGTAAVNATTNGHHHNFGLHLHHSLTNTGNHGSNHGSSANLHLPLIQNTNSHHLNHRNRQQHLSGSTAAAAIAAINSHFIKHSHHQFNQLNNNSSNINLSQNSHYHATNENSHHHPMGSLSASSNSSAMSSSSSSPSASVSPTSIAPVTPPQHNSLIGAGGLGAGFHNNQHQLTTANNLQPQNNNNSSNLQQSQQQNTSRYKTELCRPFEENGTCKYGEKCQFAHGVGELRTLTRHPKYKTEFCRTFHTTGFCPYGLRCHFIHNGKIPASPASISLGNYANLPFGQQASHSASPSTSPISSTSTATTANGSASSASSSAYSSSVSPPSPTSRLLDLTVGGSSGSYSYVSDVLSNDVNRRNRRTLNGLLADSTSLNEGHQLRKTAGHFNAAVTSPISNVPASNAVTSTPSLSSMINENDEVSRSPSSNNGCASGNQRLFWLHSHMNESSRWPPAMCASGLISGNSRRTWQMQA